MNKAKFYGNKERFMETIKDMKQCQTTMNENIFCSEDGKTFIELIGIEHDIYVWNVKVVTEGKSLNNAGYHMIHTRRGTKLVHRLMADAWLLDSTNYNKPFEVNHINGNKENNSRFNLELVTHRENMRKAWENNQIARKHTFNGKYNKKKQELILEDRTRIKMTPSEYVAWRIDRHLPIKGWMIEYTSRAKAYLYRIDDFSL